MKHDMFKKAKRFLRDKTNELENAREDSVNLAPAQKALKEARRAMQAAERALHQARFEAATLASAHFPEFGHFRGKGSLRRSSAGTFWPKCLYNSNLCSSTSCCSARTGSAGKLRVIASAYERHHRRVNEQSLLVLIEVSAQHVVVFEDGHVRFRKTPETEV